MVCLNTVVGAGSLAGPPKLCAGGYHRATHHILVEVVHHHPGQARVTPVAMYKQQLLEVFEAGDGKVTGHNSLRRQNRDIGFYPWPPMNQSLP